MTDIPGSIPGSIRANIRSDDPAPGDPGKGSREKKPTATAKEASTARRIASGPTDKAIRDSVETCYGFASMAISMFDSEIGTAIAKCTEDNAFGPSAPEAWVELARQFPAVRNAIIGMGGVGTIGQLFAAHAPLLMVLSAKFAPQSFFGANVPTAETSNGFVEDATLFNGFPTAPDPVVSQ